MCAVGDRDAVAARVRVREPVFDDVGVRGGVAAAEVLAVSEIEGVPDCGVTVAVIVAESVDVIVLRVEGVGIGARMCATVSHVGLARSFAAVAARRLSGANAMADYRQQ